MAWKLNYSSKQVGHIVKDCTGKTFGDLVHGMKVKKGTELLLVVNTHQSRSRRWWAMLL